MAQYIWQELAASGLFIYIQRKLGVKENSAIWQKLKQSTAGVGWCWHPKNTVPRSNNSGLSQLRCKGWAGQTPGCSFHLCECPEEKTEPTSRAGTQSPSGSSVLSPGNQMSADKSRKILFEEIQAAGVSSSDNHIRLPAQTCGEFIPSQTNSVFTRSPKQSYWKENMLNELCSRRFKNVIYVFKNQGRENRQDQILKALDKCNAYET